MDFVRVQELAAIMQDTMYRHVMIPTCIGSRHLGMPAKFCAIVHAVKMELGSWPQVHRFMARVVQILTDYGPESGFSDIPAFDLRTLFPHWSDGQVLVADATMQGDEEDTGCNNEMQMIGATAGVISFSGSIPTPGVEQSI